MSTTKITEIKPVDVLCGRGGLSNSHVGNKMFRNVIFENRFLYKKCTHPRTKAHLITSIVQAIQKHGGRFLKKNPEGGKNEWIEISEKEATAKTSQALRDASDRENSNKSKLAMSAQKKKIIHQVTPPQSPVPMMHMPPQLPPVPTSFGCQVHRVSDASSQAPFMQQACQIVHKNPMSSSPTTIESGLSEILDNILADDGPMNLISDDEESQSNTESVRHVSFSSMDLLEPLGPNDFSLESSPFEFENFCQGLAETLCP